MKNMTLKSITLFFCLFGILIRLYGLEFQSLWYDELFSILNSSLPSIESVLSNYLSETNPPFYAIILHYWIKLLGNSVFFARLLSALFGILTIGILFYYYNKPKFFQARVYFFVLLIFSTCLGGIYFSQEARSYSLLFLLSLILLLQSIHLLLMISNKNTINLFYLIYLSATSLLISYTHYFGFIFAGIIWANLLILSLFKLNKKDFLIFSIFSFFIVIGYSYEILKLTKLQSDSVNWIPKPNLMIYLEFLNYIIFILKGKYTYYFFVAILILVIIAYFKNKIHKFTKDEKIINIFLMSIVIVLLCSTFLISQYKPLVTGRNLLILIFPILFILSLNLSKINFPSSLTFDIVFIMFICYTFFSYYNSYTLPHKSDIRQLAIDSTILENKDLPVFVAEHPEYYNYYFDNYFKRNIHSSLIPEKFDSKPEKFIILEAELLGSIDESFWRDLEKEFFIERKQYFKARFSKLSKKNSITIK